MTDYRDRIGKNSKQWSGGMQTGASKDDVTIESIRVEPSEVAPGGTVNVKVMCKEHVYLMGSDNLCVGTGDWRTDSGYLVEVDVSTSWGGSGRATGCIPQFNTGTGTKEIPVVLGVGSDLQPGSYEIDVDVSAGNTGDHLASESASVSVSEEGSVGENCSSSSDCSKGYECVEGICKKSDDGGGSGLDIGKWVLKNPVESGLGLLGFSIVVNQLTR